jgi:purine nucleoside phosphorylase
MVGAPGIHPANESTPGQRAALTLSTMCACGHERRDHRGLYMQATGPCLECRCERFMRAPVAADLFKMEMEMERIRAAFDQLQRLRAVVARLRAT